MGHGDILAIARLGNAGSFSETSTSAAIGSCVISGLGTQDSESVLRIIVSQEAAINHQKYVDAVARREKQRQALEKKRAECMGAERHRHREEMQQGQATEAARKTTAQA